MEILNRIFEIIYKIFFFSPLNSTPKFVRFNETNTLKPYGSTSTASTIASLCSSVMMSSNSIKSFKTANSTFDSTLDTPTKLTASLAVNKTQSNDRTKNGALDQNDAQHQQQIDQVGCYRMINFMMKIKRKTKYLKPTFS